MREQPAAARVADPSHHPIVRDHLRTHARTASRHACTPPTQSARTHQALALQRGAVERIHTRRTRRPTTAGHSGHVHGPLVSRDLIDVLNSNVRMHLSNADVSPSVVIHAMGFRGGARAWGAAHRQISRGSWRAPAIPLLLFVALVSRVCYCACSALVVGVFNCCAAFSVPCIVPFRCPSDIMEGLYKARHGAAWRRGPTTGSTDAPRPVYTYVQRPERMTRTVRPRRSIIQL